MFLAPSPRPSTKTTSPPLPTQPTQANHDRTSDQKAIMKRHSRARFRPLSPSHINQQFGGGVNSPTSPLENKEYGSFGRRVESPDSAGPGVDGAFGSMRAHFRPGTDEWRRLIEGQEKELERERGSVDSFAKLYDIL
jgi:hypothetical protein